MNRHNKLIKLLNIIGLLSGLIAIISIILVGETFGLPGSKDYRTYESFNRLMAFLIFFQTSALLAFYLQIQNSLPRIGKFTVIVVVLAWVGMAAGTAAEFWLFSDLSYGVSNMRSTAFSIFSFSGLIAGFGLFVLGIVVLRNRQIPRSIGLLFIFYLPVDIVIFIGDQSIFLPSALLSILLASFSLRTSSETEVSRN